VEINLMVNTKGSVYDMGKTKLVSEYLRLFFFYLCKTLSDGEEIFSWA